MVLKPSQILAQLDAKQADFQNFGQTALQLLQTYKAALTDAAQLSHTQLALLQEGGVGENPGATPLEALGNCPHWVLPSNLTWTSREQSLAWVRDRLTGIATFAVDGSQIYPTKDLSIPVALVQIGWFENRHLPMGEYEKDIRVDVMTPTDLRVERAGDIVDRRVNMRRFELETQRLIEYMEAHAGAEDCLVFLDGSLVATFAEPFEEPVRAFYTRCILALLRAADRHRVPLVAYIDTSYARDLTVMLQQLYELPEARTIHDAQLLGSFMKWGDRTPLFLCRRSGILSQYQEQQEQIAFTYLKAHDGYPVRLELPLWLYERDRLEQILDWVRGEIIIGSGYPYVIETADQTAVLKTEDRQAFYKLFQEWAEGEQLHLRLSRKMVSKVRRR
ncbi:NurA domain-containing protein [Leptolyngbya sp. 'hensonii']|uniref:DNA double-strand break repair nuclease NurA n=1 Tax=Leptolyngbya sp. 'hensonii' TaxID=1922337 RepID=UPI00094F6F79|nr:DNA double-strand break repair nuclease NurA [Leptolyngbya sp. 'hensonii']OLP18657.1 NurA domain-containing protein [Leptolyngbya sp. 'hensonii']